jgi:hypothetical protein
MFELPSMKLLASTIGFYCLWILLHYVAAHLYVKFCTPLSIWGIIASPFLATMPQCSALRWLIHVGGSTITAMWLILGSYLLQYLRPNQNAD